MIDKAPHRMVGGILDGIANGAAGFVNATAGAIKGIGGSIMGGLDAPFRAITGKEGPHRIADRLANGTIDTGVNFVNQGIIGSARKAGETVMRALDHPIEQIGTPFRLPKFRK